MIRLVLLIACVMLVCICAQNDCNSFNCVGCTNPSAGILQNCVWCGVDEKGSCVDKSQTATQCPSNQTTTSESVCSPVAGQPGTVTMIQCSTLAMDVCQRKCPSGVLSCVCPTSPSVSEETCIDNGLGAGAIAGIAIGAIVFVGLIVGMVVYVIRTKGDDVLVVDSNGKKIKQPKNKANVVPLAPVQQNPGSDGLWRCYADSTCNRAYHTEGELSIHLEKRHPGYTNTHSSANAGGGFGGGSFNNNNNNSFNNNNNSFNGNNSFGGGSNGFGGGGSFGGNNGFGSPGNSFSHPQLNSNASSPNGWGTQGNSFSGDTIAQPGYSGGSGYTQAGNEGILKCNFPGCPKAYYVMADLKLHCDMRHNGQGTQPANGGGGGNNGFGGGGGGGFGGGGGSGFGGGGNGFDGRGSFAGGQSPMAQSFNGYPQQSAYDNNQAGFNNVGGSNWGGSWGNQF